MADYPLHKHNYAELVIVLEGRGIHFTEDEEYNIESGDVFVVSRGAGHGYRSGETLFLKNIMFDLDKLLFPQHDLLKVPGFHVLFNIEPAMRKSHEFKSRLRLSENALYFVSQLSVRLQEELKNKIPGYKTMAAGLLFELLIFLSRYRSALHSAESRTVNMIGKTVSFLENNFMSPTVPLGKLSALANMSQRNFQRYFKKATGRSPINYLLNLRIEKAKTLLLSFPYMQISEIAQRSGFGDSNYFSRQFKAISGLSPRLYRTERGNASLHALDSVIK